MPESFTQCSQGTSGLAGSASFAFRERSSIGSLSLPPVHCPLVPATCSLLGIPSPSVAVVRRSFLDLY